MSRNIGCTWAFAGVGPGVTGTTSQKTFSAAAWGPGMGIGMARRRRAISRDGRDCYLASEMAGARINTIHTEAGSAQLDRSGFTATKISRPDAPSFGPLTRSADTCGLPMVERVLDERAAVEFDALGQLPRYLAGLLGGGHQRPASTPGSRIWPTHHEADLAGTSRARRA